MISPKVLITTIIVSIIILIGVVFIFSKSDADFAAKLKTYAATETSKPKAKTDKVSADLGTMKAADEKSAEFLITNVGQKPLQLYEGSSSCNCTFGQIKIGSVWSGEFGMHAPKNSISEIAPGKSAQIKVIYRPYIMPIYGKISRQVFLSTNDPLTPKLTFNVNAFVE